MAAIGIGPSPAALVGLTKLPFLKCGDIVKFVRPPARKWDLAWMKIGVDYGWKSGQNCEIDMLHMHTRYADAA